MKRDDRNADKKARLVEANFSLAMFLNDVIDELKRLGLYDNKISIFSNAEEIGIYGISSKIVAMLATYGVISCQQVLSVHPEIFLNLTLSDNFHLRGEIQAKEESDVTKALLKYLENYDLLEVPEEQGLKPSDLDLI